MSSTDDAAKELRYKRPVGVIIANCKGAVSYHPLGLVIASSFFVGNLLSINQILPHFLSFIVSPAYAYLFCYFVSDLSFLIQPLISSCVLFLCSPLVFFFLIFRQELNANLWIVDYAFYNFISCI